METGNPRWFSLTPDNGAEKRTSGLPPNIAKTVCTVGTFDGVHRGHRDVLERLVDRAQATNLPSVVVSFHPHPLEIVRPFDAPPLLTTGDEKMELLAEAGVNYLLVIPFTESLSRFSAEQFVDEVLLGRARMAELLVGYDHGFGRARTGDAETLQLIGSRRGFSVGVVPPVEGEGGLPVSSTVVRRAVSAGDLPSATRALGRLYSVSGTVERGAGMGRKLGYPTINVSLPTERKLLPPHGVYAVRVQTPLGPFGGMLSHGTRPTFSKYDVTIEANLFDVEANFYGSPVKVEFISRIRDIERFSGAEELRQAIAGDELAARNALTPWLHSNNINSYTRQQT